ncbi:MAG: MoxR family ATPase [Bacteroidota bacterium]
MKIRINSNQEDNYKASKDLLAAINTALFLRRPLLISGEPGTGKTECADFVARQLKKAYPEKFKSETALRFNTKSVSQSTDLFYQYDAVGHFGDQENGSKESFISFNSLGKAVLRTHASNEDWASFQNYRTEVANGNEGFGSVVLIDEIDKAPRDFPNDLLAELEKPPFKFNIKELNHLEFKQNDEMPIIVIITSNSEKGLPDAFLRRCVFHHISFPKPEVLLEIVKAKLHSNDPGFTKAIELFERFRSLTNIGKPPATSELIDWISCLMEEKLLEKELGELPTASKKYREKLKDTLGVIAKNKADFDILNREIERK